MKRAARFIRAVAIGATPALTGVRVAFTLAGGVTTVVVALAANVALAAVVALAVLLALVLFGTFRAWAALDARVRAYEGATELQQGIAAYLRDGRELQRRLATTAPENVRHVEDDLFQWAGDVFEFLERAPAWELAREWQQLEGIDAHSSDEFAAALGSQSRSIPREAMLDYMRRGIALLEQFSARLSH